MFGPYAILSGCTARVALIATDGMFSDVLLLAFALRARRRERSEGKGGNNLQQEVNPS